MRKWVRIIFGGMFVLLGINHFISTSFYVAIMRPYLPFPLELVYLSGLAEIVLGAMLAFDFMTKYAAWGLIALLIAVFPVNIHMALNPQSFPAIPAWLLYLRLPSQLVMIGIAFWLTRPK